MPNWCNNLLKIEGQSEEVKDFISKNSIDGLLQFSALLPRPKSAEEDGSWYDWSVKHWGTKWDLHQDDNISFELSTGVEGQTVGECFFPTAWAPPIPWIEHVSKIFHGLTISIWYDEPGGAFAGLYKIQNGEEAQASWHGESTEFMFCSAPNCEESVYGPSAWDRDNAEIGNLKIYCEEYHALEGEVFKISTSEEHASHPV